MKKELILYYFVCFCLLINILVGQNKKLDSLLKLNNTTKEDTIKARNLFLIGEYYRSNYSFDTALQFYNQSLKLSEKINSKRVISKCFNSIGGIYEAQGDYSKALEYYFNALKINEKLRHKKGIATCYSNIGIIYENQSNFPKAVEYYTKALKINEELKDKKEIAASYSDIGIVYENQSILPKALEYYFKSLKINEEIGNKKGASACYNNIGNIYEDQGNYSKAIDYYNKALAIKQEIGDKKGLSFCYNNIGGIYYLQNNYPNALEYFNKSIKIKEELGDKKGIATTLLNITTINIELSNYKLAIEEARKIISISKEINSLDLLKDGYNLLSEAEFNLGNFKSAYLNYKTFKQINDSIFNAENSKQLGDLITKFEVEKKETELKAQAQEQALINSEEKKRQQLIIYSIVSLLLIVVIFSALLYKRFILANKQKAIIELKEKETHAQKEIIEEKHKEITDSINYAERIQRSFLATKESLDTYLKPNNYFILFKPKDVVSGDFYWSHTLLNGNFAFVTADSTGHGVPGAIMSLLNITSLEKAVEQTSNPAEILDLTRRNIINRLKKDGSAEGGKDGMDCSLIVFDNKNKQLLVAAAHNPVWIVRPVTVISSEVEKDSENGKGLDFARPDKSSASIIEIKADKMPVGKHDRDTEAFTLHTIDLQSGDMIYALTDGFPDQFGGPKGKKFMSKNLKELLVNNAHLSLSEQQALLNKTFSEWIGNIEQVDDITLVGIKV
ncbi:MAG: tetratricopeptide repeat protein [Bacteroidetes bacterium]|nr:tetratricopeptide repeat protein [Bacteroidota bacterium]